MMRTIRISNAYPLYRFSVKHITDHLFEVRQRQHC